MAATSIQYDIQAGAPVQVRSMKQTQGTHSTAGTVHSQRGGVLTVEMAEALAPGTYVGIETPNALLLAEASESCRWGTGTQVSFNINQVIPFQADLHNLMVAVNSRAIPQASQNSAQIRRA